MTRDADRVRDIRDANGRIDLDLVWDVIDRDVPALFRALPDV